MYTQLFIGFLFGFAFAIPLFIMLRKEKENNATLTESYQSMLSEISSAKEVIAVAKNTEENLHEKFSEQSTYISRINDELSQLRERNEKAATEYAKLQTRMASEQENFQQQRAQFDETSNRTAEIKKVLDIGLKMSDEATNLSKALKGDSQKRGAWGEAQLERTLEMSGLILDEHFEKQTAFKDKEGKNKQTDYLIKLPDEKHIIIDSKVTMVAYERAVNAETDELANIAMTEHVNAVRGHIDDLASKDYTNLVGMKSPSFVLMFMPIEPAYIDALKAKKDIFDYGYSKGIILVSHTTLIPILKTVSNLWMIDRSNKEARVISESAADIFNNVCTVADRMQKLGNTLAAASNHYNSTVKSLTGNQGLYGKVDRFKTLSAKVSKTLPELDDKHHDFDSERLDLAVETLKASEESSLLPENTTQQ